MKFRLYVDDLRPKPIGWLLARTNEEAIRCLRILDKNDCEIISLDYNMDQDEENGVTTLELLEWMKNNNIWPNQGFVIHTSNYYGREKLKKFIEKFSPVPILEIKYY